MGSVPSTLAGVVQGSVLYLVGVLTGSEDAKRMGTTILQGDTCGTAECESVAQKPDDLDSVRRELREWTQALMQSKDSCGSKAKLQQRLQRGEAELRDMEAKYQQLEEEGRNYPVPLYLQEKACKGTNNIAVAGCSGVGKSLLVNAMRGVKFGDPTYAPVGTKHMTLSPQMYHLPREESIQLWDLPGAGSKRYPRETYSAVTGLRHFDAVLLVTGFRFTQTDAEIFRSLCEHGVSTLVVRTMVDHDIANNKADLQQDTEETLESIVKNLRDKGVTNPYLVNARRPDDHDFPKMMADVRKAIVSAHSSVQCSATNAGHEAKRSSSVTFEGGDPAEVVVLGGPHAGSWVECTIVGKGTQQDAYAVSLPGLPQEKRRLPNVHISALRKPQMIELEKVKVVLGTFKEVFSQKHMQTTLAAMDKVGPVTLGVKKMKLEFIAEAITPALSAIDHPFRLQVSQRLMTCIQEHQGNADVRRAAHEVEALLSIEAGGLFGIPPKVDGASIKPIKYIVNSIVGLSSSLRALWPRSGVLRTPSVEEKNR